MSDHGTISEDSLSPHDTMGREGKGRDLLTTSTSKDNVENPDFAGVIEDLRASEAALIEDRAGLQREVLRLLRENGALRRELTVHREEEKDSPDVKAVLAYWKQQLGHGKAKIPLTGERAKKVRARLREGHTVDQLKEAIDGCAKLPFVGPHGRCTTGGANNRHDDITLICRDEATVDRFRKYVVESKPETPKPRPAYHETGIDAVLGKLASVKPCGLQQWMASCPAHDDRTASLSVAQGRKGAVVHCFAGCSLEQITRAMGLEIGALFDPEETPVAPLPKLLAVLPGEEVITDLTKRLLGYPALLARLRELRGWEPSTLAKLGIGWDGERLTIPVRNAQGVLVNVLRYLPRRVNGETKLLASKGAPRDLFPSPELMGDDITLVEGEPDAITGHQMGLPAVALPGVKGWKAPWASRFDGKRVTICFDCDDEGRQAAQRVLEALQGHAESVQVRDLAPNRSDGYDLSDELLAVAA